MKTVTRKDAVDSLLDVFRVDFTDFMDASYPNAHGRFLAITIVELQLEIMTARAKGDHCAVRIAGLANGWRDNHNVINSYALEISQLADRVAALLKIRNLAMTSFREGQS